MKLSLDLMRQARCRMEENYGGETPQLFMHPNVVAWTREQFPGLNVLEVKPLPKVR